MHYSLLVAALLGLLASQAAGVDQVFEPGLSLARHRCKWHNASTAEGISTWEFQLRVAKGRNATLPRAEWEATVERSFAAVQSSLPALRFEAGSRRTMIWHEAERAISTEDGKPLDPAAKQDFPFRQIGVLRLRLCLAVDAAPAAAHLERLLRPGEADLTLKLKGIDPAAPPRWHEDFKAKARGAKLEVKREDDVHCAYERVSYSAMYHRAHRTDVRMLHKLRRVKSYFPTLPKRLHLDPSVSLPPHLNHYQSKTYWDVDFAGVPGTVQLYANSPSRSSALAGTASYPWELSMRVRRVDAGDRLDEVLELVAAAADVLGENGWESGYAAAPLRSGELASAVL